MGALCRVSAVMNNYQFDMNTGNTYTGSTPVFWALDGKPAKAAEMIADPFFDLSNADQMNATTECLRALTAIIPAKLAAHVAVCEFSSDDSTPTLHIDLWRGSDISDLPEAVAGLSVANEGFWDGGRSYSLQIA